MEKLKKQICDIIDNAKEDIQGKIWHNSGMLNPTSKQELDAIVSKLTSLSNEVYKLEIKQIQ